MEKHVISRKVTFKNTPVFICQVYCRVCYLKNFGPGGKNKFGDKTHFEAEDADPDACIRCHGKVRSQIK